MLRSLAYTLCLLALAGGDFSLAGCGENRSNLLPKDTVTQINANIDKVSVLFNQGNCFSAFDVDKKLQAQVFALRNSDVDETLRKNLEDGINQLNVNLHSTCVQTDTSTVPQTGTLEPPTVTPDDVTGTTGETDETGDAGATGTTGEKSKNNGKTKPDQTGGGQKEPSNPANPTPPPEPTPPTTKPEPTPPDTGGVSPG